MRRKPRVGPSAALFPPRNPKSPKPTKTPQKTPNSLRLGPFQPFSPQNASPNFPDFSVFSPNFPLHFHLFPRRLIAHFRTFRPNSPFFSFCHIFFQNSPFFPHFLPLPRYFPPVLRFSAAVLPVFQLKNPKFGRFWPISQRPFPAILPFFITDRKTIIFNLNFGGKTWNLASSGGRGDGAGAPVGLPALISEIGPAPN